MTKDDELLEHVLSKLRQDFDALDSISELAKGEAASNRRLETLATVANSRNKTARTIFACMALKGDPRFRQLLQGGERDIARLVRNLLALDGKKGLMMFKDALPQKTRIQVMKDGESQKKQMLVFKDPFQKSRIEFTKEFPKKRSGARKEN